MGALAKRTHGPPAESDRRPQHQEQPADQLVLVEIRCRNPHDVSGRELDFGLVAKVGVADDLQAVVSWKCSVTNTMSLIEKLSTLSLSTYAPSLSLWTVLAGFDDAKKSSCRVCTVDQMRDLVRLWQRHE